MDFFSLFIYFFYNGYLVILLKAWLWDLDLYITKMTIKNYLPSELLSLACSLPWIVSFWLKQQYQEAYRVLHHVSSKDDLKCIYYVIMFREWGK